MDTYLAEQNIIVHISSAAAAAAIKCTPQIIEALRTSHKEMIDIHYEIPASSLGKLHWRAPLAQLVFVVCFQFTLILKSECT